jgi:hypothetical protein
MKSSTTAGFRRQLAALPDPVRRQARKQFRGEIGVSQRFLTAFTPFSPAAPAYRAAFSYKFFHRSVKSFVKTPSTLLLEIPARDANSTAPRTTEAATPRLDCELRLFLAASPEEMEKKSTEQQSRIFD